VSLTIGKPDGLDSDQIAVIRALADTFEHEYGEPPLSDAALTHLRSTRVLHRVATDADTLVGYAQLDGDSLEIVATGPAVDALLESVEPGPGAALLVWSHGARSPIAPALAHRGYEQVRTLHQLRRPLDQLPAPAPLPDGVTVRPFRPGADDAAWLSVNAAAFASHPEQAGVTAEDLGARMREPWFDPAGFLLAERDATLLGFHWTKIHADGTGEVYVLGVAPAAKGLRLGPALLSRGLESLAERGCREVLLYVDESNDHAMRLYADFGFHRHDHDIQWRGR
jgi:mycothiol synthase